MAGARLDRVTVAAALLAVLLFAIAARPEARADAGAVAPILVADLRGHALLVVDPHHPEEARRIALPGGPHELLRLPDGRVVTSLEQSGALAFVDLETGAVETRVVEGVPHGLAFDHARGLLLVTDRAAGTVRRFTLDPWHEVEPLPAPDWPHAVGVTSTGSVVVALAGADAISIDGRAIAAPALPETVALASDGRIATAGADDGVVAVTAADGTRIETVEVGGRPVRVAFDASGRRLGGALSATGAVAVIEGGQVRHIPVAGVPDGIVFSSDGRWLYASDVFGGAVSVVDVEAGAVVAVLRVAEGTGAILVLDAE